MYKESNDIPNLVFLGGVNRSRHQESECNISNNDSISPSNARTVYHLKFEQDCVRISDDSEL